MENSLEILKKVIDEIGGDWKQKFIVFLNEEKELDEEDEKRFECFVEAYREDVINDDLKRKNEVKKLIDNDILSDNLQEYIQQRLVVYYAFACVRAMEAKDQENTIRVIEELFKKGIVRINPELVDCYAELGFESKESLVDLLNAFSSICDFVVYRNLYVDSISKAIYENTRISERVCAYIAELIDQNFESLKTRIILENLIEDEK